MKYHVILKEQLFPEHLTDGILKSTMLGNEYQIMIHLNSENKVYKVIIISALNQTVCAINSKMTEYNFLFFRR